MIELGRGHALSTAAPDVYLARWVDHESWPQWSPDTEWARVDGPIRTGARGQLKPRGGPRVRFRVTACRAAADGSDATYEDTTALPGATLVFRHDARATAGGTELEVLVTMTGPLARIWAKIMGGGFAESAPADLERLVRLAEGAARDIDA